MTKDKGLLPIGTNCYILEENRIEKNRKEENREKKKPQWDYKLHRWNALFRSGKVTPSPETELELLFLRQLKRELGYGR